MTAAAKPNVILILADDLGYGDAGCFGNPDIRTPHIDRLANAGVRLTQHYSASPLCAPARGALLTGCYNHTTGALSVQSNRGLDRISRTFRTVADMFRSCGYRTGMVGKWHSGLFDMRYHPNSRGFHEFTGFLNGGMDYYDWILDRNGTPFRTDGRYLTDVFTDEAEGFILRNRNTPFFLHLAYNAPHSPLQAPEEDIKPFRETDAFNMGVSTLYGMIRRMDAGIGRIAETLEHNGLLDNTIILFTSDNGPWLGRDGETGHEMMRYNGPFRGQKQDVLEGGIRVPAVVHWPGGLEGGREVHEMVHFCDWMVTLLQACECTCPDTDGINMLHTLRGDPGKSPCQRFWQFNRYEPVMQCNGAMRDGEWKLYIPRIPEAMRKQEQDGDWYRRMFTEPHFETDLPDPHFIERTLSEPSSPELYNINNDPHEDSNLAQTHPDRLNAMAHAYETWFERVQAERNALPEYGDG